MSPHELLEAALLDACGLLDEHERAAFELSFAAASEEVRASIRREQARFADLTEILPDVAPRPELRQLVIDAVAEAAGRDRDETALRLITHASADRAPSSLPMRRGSVWRVAAFGFATATVVMSVLAVQLRSEFERVRQQISSNQATQFFLNNAPNAGFRAAVLGADFDRVALASSAPSTELTQASVFINRSNGTGHLGHFKLPALGEGQQYVLVQLGDAGTPIAIVERFTPSGDIGSVRFSFDAARGEQFAIAVDRGGSLSVVMRTA